MDIIKETLKNVDKIMKPQKSVQFDVVNKKADIFDCKIGGVPYFPKDMEYPLEDTKEKNPLVLLAQINFEQIPHIPNFPKTGILQIFIAQDDCYGMDFDNLTNQKLFRIIYHKNIITDRSKLIKKLDFEINYDEYMLPHNGVFKLVPNEITTMKVDPHTEDFSDLFVQEYNKLTEDKINSIFDLDDEIGNSLFNRNERKPAFISGYPIFTQEDPRYDKRYQEHNIVLFELDSYTSKDRKIDIMWGDCGTGSFLIRLEDLKKLDFSNVVYNYDCC